MAKPKILLVDDTKLILELEKSFLKVSHVDVITAGDGVEALELVRKDAPDLIFMDVNMPLMDGITCCRLLKSDPFLSAIPVVMLTTLGNDEDRQRAHEAGCNDFLTKPVDRRLFLEMARKYTDAVDRRDLRVPCHIPVLFLLGGSPVGAHALDIGDGGLFLASREEVLPNQELRLALFLETEQAPLLELKGRVAWVNQEGKRVHAGLPTGFGVEFSEPAQWQADELKRFVEAARG
ncbi:response regulator [Geomonas paludis]|uniref:Response regulator n=1 Tax=Geomonas paludis TaxID=2740185 RepID=A0A6V8MTN8_9BACT|nr:response regulator [Geomonas paludis]UPU35339.1 response regulator [Geomonas paludis]GFO63097.1 two-component system response regulator [Geomonas paludis]